MTRCIFPFLAELGRIDASSISYDADFEEPVRGGADGAGPTERGELPPVRVKCQVEPSTYEEIAQGAAGNMPRTRLGLVFTFRDLERQGLVDAATGEARLRQGDRLIALYDVNGQPVQVVRTPPGLYITEVRPIGFGLFRRRPRRNLLLCNFEDRPQGLRRSS